MNRKIGVLLGPEGKTISVNEPGVIQIYEKAGEQWEIRDQVVFDMDQKLGLNGVREKVTQTAEGLEDCKVLVAKEITGLSYSILDRMDFHLWEMEGSPEEFLDYIEIHEIQAVYDEGTKAEEKNPLSFFEMGEYGCYQIDLKQLQEHHELTSKQVLLPFLNATRFNELRIVCSHMPPWFEKELPGRQLRAEVYQKAHGECEVILYPKGCSSCQEEESSCKTGCCKG